ncbi:MDR family MFS transporter [Nonomuraea rubra]|uniref:MDR family MFS transporter n=1 Tax=Nonomuraea rubra TaxID=46180 RepID=UPI003611F71A
MKAQRSTSPGVAAAMCALILAVLLAALDQTIVSTALPRIAEDLNGFDDIAWVSAAYLLASTAVTPLWGKLGDMYGRKRLYLASTTIFLIASVACGLVQNLPELIGSRVLQGVGGGGMIVLTFALVGDIAAPSQRGRYQAMFGSVYGVASIVGPLLGGVFTDQLSWRWAFLINLPIGAVALVIAARALPAVARQTTARIDYLGASMLAAIATGLILITSFGARWGWGSPAILGLIAATVALAVLLVPVERHAAAPVLPPAMFASWTVVGPSLIAFVANAAMFSVLVYLPTYLQIVHGVSATLSGISMLPLVAGLVASQSLAGRWAANAGRLRRILLAGLLVNLAGLLLLSTIGAATNALVLSSYFLITGVGIGMVPMVVMTTVQNSVPPPISAPPAPWSPSPAPSARPSASPSSPPCSTPASPAAPAACRHSEASTPAAPTPSLSSLPPRATSRWRPSPTPRPPATSGWRPPSPSASCSPSSSGRPAGPKGQAVSPASPPARTPSRPPDLPRRPRWCWLVVRRGPSPQTRSHLVCGCGDHGVASRGGGIAASGRTV